MAVRKVTIKDVAREAGVSISTVSNALNDVDVLHPDTKRHILEVAERLNYTSNVCGRSSKSSATNVIGLFINSIRGPFYGALADSIFAECKNWGYELNIFLSDSPEKMMDTIIGKRVDGAIILNEWIKEEHENILLENNIPVVFIDREKNAPHISCVIFDSYSEGEQAAKYLLELGNKSFMFMKGISHNYDSIERQRGFENVLKQAGYPLRRDYILDGEFEREMAYHSINDFLETGKMLPDAIFAANDESAIGAMEALLENGIRVPEDVSVMGCDDIELTRRVRPTLSTVRTSFERQGTLAVEQLVRLIRGEGEGEIEILHGRIIPRESTCLRD